MNHIYKVVFNKATGTFTAVAEYAKGQGKSCSVKSSTFVAASPRLLLTSLAYALLLTGLAGGQAWGAFTVNGGQAAGSGSKQCFYDVQTQSVICGDNTTKVENTGTDKPQSVVLGKGAVGNGKRLIAIGEQAKANDDQSIAVGSEAEARGNQSIAIGGDTIAKGDSSIAIGGDDLYKVASNNPPAWNVTGNNATLNNTAAALKYHVLTGDDLVNFASSDINQRFINTKAGKGAVALGVSATAAGDLSTAFGTRAKAEGVASLALGVGSTASKENAVVLGAGSKDDQQAMRVSEAEINGITYSGFAGYNGITMGDLVSVGTAGFERQIKHVAPGAVTATSTDAINGSQLFAVTKGTQTYFHVNENIASQGEGDATTNLGAIRDKAGAKGTNAVTAGVNAKAEGNKATALGFRANASGFNAIAIGNGAKAKEKKYAVGLILGDTVAIGSNAEANEYKTTAIGAYAGQGAEPGGGSVYLGDRAGQVAKNHTIGKNNKGYNTWGAIYIGQEAGAVSIGDANIGIGSEAGKEHSGSQNIFIGDTAKTSTSKGNRNVILGNRYIDGFVKATDAGGINDVIAIGTLANATNSQAIAIGSSKQNGIDGAVASGERSIAIGVSTDETKKGAQASGDDSVALGTESIAQGAKSVAIGSGNKVSGEESIAIGKGHTVSGSNSGTFGDPNTISGNSSYAIGNDNTIAQDNTFVLGNGVTTTQANSVVLGSASTDRAATKEAEATLNNITYGTFAGQGSPANGVVSVGSTGKERQLINVAAGKISDTSTDAINGSQLHATNAVVGNVANSTVANLGGNAALAADGTITMTDVGGTGESTIHDAIKAADQNTYFHTNATGTVQPRVDSNLGKLDDTAGASGINATTAGINAKATGNAGLAVGYKATAYDDNAIAIGNGAYVDNYATTKTVNTSDGIAIGTNARSVQGGLRDGALGGVIPSSPLIDNYIPGSTKGIAIGRNTYSNESTVDIGAKSVGNESRGANRRAVTSVGADSFAAAHFSTVLGSYSEIKTKPGVTLNGFHSQGFASSITGALNTINADSDKTQNASEFDGIANVINGTGNTIDHSNGTLILGAGNKVSNSRKSADLSALTNLGFLSITNKESYNEAINKVELASVGVIGGRNSVDNAQFSNIQGVKNTLTGVIDGDASKFVSIDGYKNTATNVSNLSQQGSNNTVENADQNIVMGDNNQLMGDNANRSQAKRNVILGFQDAVGKIGKNITNNQIIGSNVTVAEGTTNSVLIGDAAEVSANGAVALGAQSNADRAALTAGAGTSSSASAASNTVYASTQASATDKDAISDTVQGNLAAVSVGNADNTRQITNVAAGSDNTDAVNVAQLKSVANIASSPLTFTGNANTDTNNDGTQQQLGSTLNIIGSKTAVVGLAEDVSNKTIAGSYSAKNLQTVITDGQVQVQMAENPEFSSVKVGDETNNTLLTSTANGLDVGGDKITNVADGTADTDAVNFSQLKKAQASATSKVTTNTEEQLSVETINNNDGSTTYQVNADVTDLVTDSNGSVITPTTNANGLVTAADVASTINATGWNLQVDGSAVDVVNPSDTVNFINGSGTDAVVTTDNGTSTVTYNVKTDGVTTQISGGKVTAVTDDFTTTTTGTVTADNGTALATASDIATAINSASFKAEGKNSTTQVTAQDGSVQISAGDTLSLEAGKNLELTIDNMGAIQLSTSTDVDFNKVTAGTGVNQVILNNNGINVGGNTYISNTGINANSKKITNVVAGTADTDAVNVSQLNKVKDLATAAKTTVKAGNNVTVSEDGATNTYTVNADSASVSGSDLVNVTAGTKDTNGNTDYAVDLSAKAKASLAKADTAIQSVTGDSNILATTDTDHNVTLKLADNITANSVTTGDVSISNTGINAGNKQITNVASGGDVNANAANIGDVKAAAQKSKTEVKAGKQVTIDSTTAADGHSVYTVNSTKTTVEAETNSAIAVTGGTENTDGLLTYKVDLTENTKDEIKKGVDADTAVKKGLFFTGDQSTKTDKIDLGDEVAITGDTNITTKASGKGIAISLNNALTGINSISGGSGNGSKIIFGDKTINIDGAKITNVAAGETDTDAVNLGQLNKVKDLATAAKTTVKAGNNVTVSEDSATNTYTVNANSASVSGSTLVKVTTGTKDANGNTDYAVDLTEKAKNSLAKADTAVQSVTGDSNILATTDADHNVTLKLADNITANSVTTGAVSISTAGINAGNKQITNVASGGDVDTNAANIGDVKAAAQKSKTEVAAGKNIDVTSTTGSNGQTIYTVKTKADVEFDKVSVGDVVIDKNTNDVTGLANKTLGDTGFATKGRAATEEQLNTTQDNLVKVLGGKAKNVDGNVTTTNIGGTGKNNINDAIKAATTIVKSSDDSISVVDSKNTDGANVYDIKVDSQGIAESAQLPVVYTNANGDKLYKQKDGSFNTAKDGSGTTVAPADIIASMQNADGTTTSPTKLANVAKGLLAENSTEAVNGSQLYATNQKVAGNTTNIAKNNNAIATNTGNIATNSTNIANNSNAIATNTTNIASNTAAINKGLSVGDGKTANNYQLGETVNITGDSNITTKTVDGGVEVGLAKNVAVDSLTAGKTLVDENGITITNPNAPNSPVKVTNQGLDNGGNTIANVAPGVNGTDAVNVNQLKNLGYNLNNKIDEVGDEANAGVSSAMAMAALPQAYIPGKSMITGGMATYNGQGAVAVGLSKLSDNGRWVLKISGSADTEGNAGGAVGAGFHF